MAQRDFYTVLGVSKTATADEIRAAYRKLARQYHPDVNKTPEASKLFNEVQQAYDVLSDPEKRALYDQYGDAEARPGPQAGGRAGPHVRWSTVGAPGGGGYGDFDPDDLGDIFEAMFGGSRNAGPGAGGRTRAGGRARPRSAAPQATPIHRHDVSITFMTAVRGGTEQLRLTADGSARTIEVTIPPGIDDGGQLRIRGAVGGEDLILTVKVGGHPIFRRGDPDGGPAASGKGLNLWLDLPLTIAEATLGATVPVPTLEGAVQLTVPAGTPSGRKLRLKGRGVKNAKGESGDLYAIVKVVAPAGDELTPKQREALESIAAKGPAPRADPAWVDAVGGS